MKRSVLDLMRADHASVRRLLDLLDEAAVGPPERRELLVRRLRQVVNEHVAAEERTVYLSFMGEGSDGELAAAMHDHVVVRGLLAELAEMAPEGPRWMQRVAELRRLIERHALREERAVFAAMGNVPVPELDAMAERFMTGQRRQHEEA